MKRQTHSASSLKQAWVVLLLIIFLLVASYALYYNSQSTTHYRERLPRAYHNNSLTHALPDSSYAPVLQTPRIIASNKTDRLQALKHEPEISQEKVANVQPTKQPSITEELFRNAVVALANGNGKLETVINVQATKQPTVTEELFRNAVVATGDGKQHCNVSGIKSWQQGVVTSLQPMIEKDCQRLIDGAQGEVYKVRKQLKQWRNAESYDQLVNRMSDCSIVNEEFSNVFYVSPVERNFPIAYIFVVYTKVRQVVRLLKSIYRPHNLYCIHPDARQGKEFAKVFHLISKCLDNVFVASRVERVYYGHHSIMDAQLNCMRDLMKYPAPRWKYAINVCGRELPLKTNREIVTSLEKLNGASAIGDVHRIEPFFWRQRFVYKHALNRRGKMYKTHNRLGRPPYSINIFKSMNFIAASKPFVNFLLTSKKALSLRKYLRDVYIPEEHFYSSLYVLPEAPGGRPKDRRVKVPIVDWFIWLNSRWARQNSWMICKGSNVHSICILSCYDLPAIFKYGVYGKTPFFFSNKYFMEWDPTVMDCMEERLVKVNMEEYKQDCLLQ